MKRFPLPAPAKRTKGVTAVVTVEPCYYVDKSQGSTVLIARSFVAKAVVNPGRAGWSEGEVKTLNSLQVEQLLTRIAGEKGEVRIYTFSVALLLWTSPLLGVLAEKGWKTEWIFEGGATEMLRISRGDDNNSVTLQNVHTIAPDYNSVPDRIPSRRLRMSVDNHRSAQAQFFARVEVAEIAKCVRVWFDLVCQHSQTKPQGSIGLQAWNDWRSRDEARDNAFIYQDADLRQYCRAAYYGGLVRAFHPGDYKGKFSLVDISSSYPYAMLMRQFPMELHAWVFDLDLSTASEWLKNGCIIADVDLETNEAIYPVRDGAKLSWPTGRLRTHLASASVAYGLEQGHIKKVHTAALWTPGKPFTEWIRYWWGIRNYCNLNDQPEQAKLCKLMLNSLYGRLGMRVGQPVLEGEAPPTETRYEYGLVPLDTLPDKIKVAYASGGHVEIDGRQWVPYSDLTLLGKRVCSVQGTEPPLSLPHLSAHITDYARIYLWRKLKSLGLDTVIYCDTDSAILPASKVPRSMRRAKAPKIGQWSVREEGDSLQVFGEKLYILHGHTTASGLPATAVPVGPYEWEAPQAQGMLELLMDGDKPGVKLNLEPFSLDPAKLLQQVGKGLKLT